MRQWCIARWTSACLCLSVCLVVVVVPCQHDVLAQPRLLPRDAKAQCMFTIETESFEHVTPCHFCDRVHCTKAFHHSRRLSYSNWTWQLRHFTAKACADIFPFFSNPHRHGDTNHDLPTNYFLRALEEHRQHVFQTRAQGSFI